VGKVIAVTNQKGGVAKTTTAVNLGAALALLGKRVLVVDMDPQGNATSGLGVKTDGSGKTVYHVLVGEAALTDVLRDCPSVAGLIVAPADLTLAAAEVEMVSLPDRELVLKKALGPVKGGFDYVFIDCPPSLGLLTVNALCVADSVLIPVQCEYYALEGLSHLINAIQLVQKGLNPSLTVEGALLTMFDGRTNLAIQVVEEVKRYFKKKVYKTIIPRNVRLSEAPSHGVPVVVYDPKSRGADMYMELAKEVMEGV